MDAPLTLIFRMWHRAYSLPFSLLRQPMRSLWNDMTIPPIDCRMCKTVNRWHSVDARLNHIATAFVHPIIVRNVSYTHYWHPILRLHVLSFASRRFITSQFLISAIHAIWERNDVALAHSRAFGRQVMASRTFHQFLVNKARLPHLSLSSSFSSTSMMNHKQFQISQPCARGVCREWWSWIHGGMQHDGRRSDWFVLSTDRSFYDTYDITHLNFVTIFRH